nr:ulp1 protease family, C-terminal catalytic domain-containing protein [Tanacetum cinerariifolium]
LKKTIEGEKNVPKTRAKKTAAAEQDIKKPQVRKQTATQLAKSKETEAKTVKRAPTKRKKKEPNDKEETAIIASPISFIPLPIDTVSEKRQGKPSNFLVIEGVYFLSLYPEIEVASTMIDLWTLVLNNEEQHKDKLSGDGNVYCHTVMMTFEIDIIDNIDNGIDDIKTRYGGFPCALMDSFIDYLERKKYKKCYDLILAEPKVVEIPWKTTYNSHDCGVFVIRNMETYLGKGNFLQELKKEGPG